MSEDVAQLLADEALLGRRVAEVLVASDAGLQTALTALFSREAQPREGGEVAGGART